MKTKSPVPIIISPAQPKETLQNDVMVMEIDVTTTTTEDNEHEQKICTIEPPRRSRHSPTKDDELTKQSGEDTLEKLSKLLDKILLAELTSEDTVWIGSQGLLQEEKNKVSN